MNFTNTTPFPALMHREAIPGGRIAAAAVLRATFDIGAPCRASLEQPWHVSKSAWKSPQPFTTMRLGLERACGGFALFDELPIPHADNPKGRGFFMEAEEAEGGALPREIRSDGQGDPLDALAMERMLASKLRDGERSNRSFRAMARSDRPEGARFHDHSSPLFR